MRTCLQVLGLCLALTACQGTEGEDSGTEPSPISVPLSKADPSDAYAVQSTAMISNEDYGDAFYGFVVISTRRANSQINTGPRLEGDVRLSDGSKVHCEKNRSTVWGSFTAFEDLDLKCETRLDLGQVIGFTITDS